MKTTILTLTATTLFLGTTAFAGPVEDLIAKLTSEGYTKIEVEQENGYIEVEAYKNGIEREIEINPETGEILKDRTEADDDDNEKDDS